MNAAILKAAAKVIAFFKLPKLFVFFLTFLFCVKKWSYSKPRNNAGIVITIIFLMNVALSKAAAKVIKVFILPNKLSLKRKNNFTALYNNLRINYPENKIFLALLI